jgi:hypothetical protein
MCVSHFVIPFVVVADTLIVSHSFRFCNFFPEFLVFHEPAAARFLPLPGRSWAGGEGEPHQPDQT